MTRNVRRQQGKIQEWRMQPIRVGRGLTQLRHSMCLSIILTGEENGVLVTRAIVLSTSGLLCAWGAVSWGLWKWPGGTERQKLTVRSLQIKPEGCLQGTVKAASATWMVWTSFSCYDVKVGFHSWLHAKLWPGDRAVCWNTGGNPSEIKHSGMLLLLSGFSRVRLCATS